MYLSVGWKHISSYSCFLCFSEYVICLSNATGIFQFDMSDLVHKMVKPNMSQYVKMFKMLKMFIYENWPWQYNTW